MKIYGEADLHAYMKEDWIAGMLDECTEEVEQHIRTQEWLVTMDNKRMIYADMYGDLLQEEKPAVRVLDVGGGYNALTKVLARNCAYTLLDFVAHDKVDVLGGGTCSVTELAQQHGVHFINGDWYEQEISDYFDIVIANDLFPDVDQRLELFLDRCLPKCKEMRLLLTFYNEPRFYTTKRVDDTEILTFLSWDGEITAMKLRKYEERFVDTTLEQLEEMVSTKESIYWNGRQCAYLRLRGDLA